MSYLIGMVFLVFLVAIGLYCFEVSKRQLTLSASLFYKASGVIAIVIALIALITILSQTYGRNI